MYGQTTSLSKSDYNSSATQTASMQTTLRQSLDSLYELNQSIEHLHSQLLGPQPTDAAKGDTAELIQFHMIPRLISNQIERAQRLIAELNAKIVG